MTDARPAMVTDAMKYEIAEYLEMRFDLQPDASLAAAEHIIAMHQAAPKAMVTDADEPCTLAECPPGLFSFDGSLGFKTEYGMTRVDENGANMPGDQVRWIVTNWPDAYCLDSGEVFWGGAKTHEERGKLIVQPLAMHRAAMNGDVVKRGII